MKDSLTDIFRQRFQGHEAPVEPGTWQAIQSQLASPAPGANTEPSPGGLKGKFAGHEVHVDPAVWQNIGVQLGHGALAGSTGGGFAGGLGWAAAGIAGLLIAGGLIYTLRSEEPKGLAQVPTPTEQVRENPVTHTATTTQPQPVPITPVGPTQNGTVGAKRPGPTSSEPSRNVLNVSETHAASTTDQAAQGPDETAKTTSGATTPPQREGAQVVNEIIAEMTDQVQQEVRANPTGSTSPDFGGAPPSADPSVTSDGSSESAPLPKLFLQNVFTPNGDGQNDVYKIISEGFTSITVRVYSVRSNQLVFSANSNEPWTGANCEDGMYMVAAEATTPDGRLVTEGKVVWLNRNPTN